MKFGCIFFFFAVFLINFQASDSVKCFGRINECSSCVKYTCLALGETVNEGCPEDFFKDCSEQVEGVNFVKSKNYNDLEYNNKDKKVGYLSGCGNEVEGTACISLKFSAMSLRMASDKQDEFCYEAGIPCKDSNTQNSAFKLTGVLTIGWMISAALIY